MDWTNQNRFSKWIISILILMNIITLIIIWVMVDRDKIPPPPLDRRPPDPIVMMQKELDLSDEQAEKFESLRNQHFVVMDSLSKEMIAIRKLLVDELFKPVADTELIELLSGKIGELEKSLEISRFNHFQEVILICSPEQQDKLKEILGKMILRKPPPGKHGDKFPDKKKVH